MMSREWQSYAVYVLVTLAVLLPMLWPGYILTMDMVFTPWLSLPSEVTSSYVFHAGLHLLNLIIPSSIIQKIMLASILLLSAIGMHRLIRHIAAHQDLSVGIYIASIFFAINPFTYSRFMAGQYAVLLGYALLPWLVRSLLAFAAKPGLKQSLWLGGIVTLIGIVSIHTLAAVTVLGVVGAIIGWWRRKEQRATLVKYGLIALATFVVLSSYWLVPLLLGHGKTATTIANFTSADTQAFMTTGSNAFARIGNSVRLQGFWAEGRQLYLLPQDRTILWGLSSLIIIALAIIGARYLWRAQRALVLWLGIATAIALLVASGLTNRLLEILPLGAGLREPHKLVMLVALSYGVFLAIGCGVCLEWLRRKHEVWYGPVAMLLVALPFLYTRVMLWGFDGQLSPRHYPQDWFAARQQLTQNAGNGRVLFLPWHSYMGFKFTGRIIAHPAPAFFGNGVIISNDPELDGAAGYAANERQQTLDRLVNPKSKPNSQTLARELARQNIAYIVLTKDYDYQKYGYIDSAPEIVKQEAYSTLTLYKNTAWRHP